MQVTRRGDVLSLCVIVVTILLNCCFVLSESNGVYHNSHNSSSNSNNASSSDVFWTAVNTATGTRGIQENYITTVILSDGEKEVRMRFGDIIVKETSISQEISQGERLVT